MKKVRMIVEMDEELYKAFAEQDVFISGMRTGKTLLSEIWKALKNATIVRMSEEKIKESCSLSLVYNEGFDKGYEKAKAEYKPKECADAVSRKTVEEMIKAEMPERGLWEIEGDKIKETVCEVCVDLMQKLSDLPPVLPKREQGEWIGVNPMVDTLMCSKCGENIISEEFKSNYCPNCGAEMR